MQPSLQDIVDALPSLAEATVVVQDTALLKVISRDAATGLVSVLRHDGQSDTLPAARLADTHFAIDGGACLKPVYRPLRALVLNDPVTVQDAGGPRHLARGDAILIDGGVAIAALSRYDYLRDYEALRPSAALEFTAATASGANG